MKTTETCVQLNCRRPHLVKNLYAAMWHRRSIWTINVLPDLSHMLQYRSPFILFYLIVILCSSIADSCISTCKLQHRGPQSTVDLTTGVCTTMLLISSTTLLGLRRRNDPKIYSVGGQSEHYPFNILYLNWNVSMPGKYSQMLLFAGNQTPQLLAKHWSNSVCLLRKRRPPESYTSHSRCLSHFQYHF